MRLQMISDHSFMTGTLCIINYAKGSYCKRSARPRRYILSIVYASGEILNRRRRMMQVGQNLISNILDRFEGALRTYFVDKPGDSHSSQIRRSSHRSSPLGTLNRRSQPAEAGITNTSRLTTTLRFINQLLVDWLR